MGPFVFFDHFGPITVRPSDNFDVRPHPHIGLATVTYLFDGAMLHRDSLGAVQAIEPGAINWMTSGRGIVHSERRPPHLRDREYTAHGLQLWAALPRAFEECDPSFSHTPASRIPAWVDDGVALRLLIGEAFDRVSPVATFAPTLYLDVQAQEGSTFELPASHAERAVYAVDAPLAIDDTEVPAQAIAVLREGVSARIAALRGARYVVIGGDPLDGPRFVWWNYVSSSRERIERAKDAWSQQRMGQSAANRNSFRCPRSVWLVVMTLALCDARRAANPPDHRRILGLTLESRSATLARRRLCRERLPMNFAIAVRRLWTRLVVVRNRLCAAALIALLALCAPAHATGTLTGDADFKLLSWLGFAQAIDGAHPEGSKLNKYAWSMTWFNGKLYVGTGATTTTAP